MNKTMEDNGTAIGELARAAGQLSSQIVGVQRGQLEINKTQVEMHQGQIEINGRIDSVTNDFNAFVRRSVTNDFKAGLRGAFLPYIHMGFDGSTGNNFFCPASFTDHTGVDRELCIISLPLAVRFFGEECPGKIPAATTQSFFLSPHFIRAAGLDYKDIINGLLLTGFAFLAVGPKWNQMRLRNTSRFVFVEAAFFMKLLKDTDMHFPDRPRNRSDLVHGGHRPNYKVDGVDFGFKEASRTDKSTGPIVQIRQTIPLERKRTMAVLGEAWVKEWYNPMVAKFFDIPDDVVGVHHVISSVVDSTSALVKSHTEAIGDYKRRKSQSAYRKRAKRARSS